MCLSVSWVAIRLVILVWEECQFNYLNSGQVQIQFWRLRGATSIACIKLDPLVLFSLSAPCLSDAARN